MDGAFICLRIGNVSYAYKIAVSLNWGKKKSFDRLRRGRSVYQSARHYIPKDEDLYQLHLESPRSSSSLRLELRSSGLLCSE